MAEDTMAMVVRAFDLSQQSGARHMLEMLVV